MSDSIVINCGKIMRFSLLVLGLAVNRSLPQKRRVWRKGQAYSRIITLEDGVRVLSSKLHLGGVRGSKASVEKKKARQSRHSEAVGRKAMC